MRERGEGGNHKTNHGALFPKYILIFLLANLKCTSRTARQEEHNHIPVTMPVSTANGPPVSLPRASAEHGSWQIGYFTRNIPPSSPGDLGTLEITCANTSQLFLLTKKMKSGHKACQNTQSKKKKKKAARGCMSIKPWRSDAFIQLLAFDGS